MFRRSCRGYFDEVFKPLPHTIDSEPPFPQTMESAPLPHTIESTAPFPHTIESPPLARVANSLLRIPHLFAFSSAPTFKRTRSETPVRDGCEWTKVSRSLIFTRRD